MNLELPDSVRIVEVGPRDGLQNEKDIVPVDTKVAFINQLARSGLRDIEVTSFVSPNAVPQLADAAEVLRQIEKLPGVRYPVLIPNLKGLERWLECAESLPGENRAIALFTAASETFNRENVNSTIAESLANFRLITDQLNQCMGPEMPFMRGYISMAFFSPYPGERINPEDVEQICANILDLGLDEVSLGDTIGAATPRDVSRLLDRLIPAFGPNRLAMHFHDTRGTALANVLRSMEHGISIFDSSAGGLGGCPFAPGASGNLATEDLVYMMNGMENETGVDLKAVVQATEIVRPYVAHELPGKELQAFRSAGF